MTVIDFRCRPITAEYVAICPRAEAINWRRWGVRRPTPEPFENHLAALETNGIDIGVFTGRQVMTEGKVTFGVTNDHVAECARRSSGRVVGFAGIDVSAGVSAVAETERSIRELGLRGISTDPRRAGLTPDDRAIYPIYEKAGELGVPVAITVGPLVGRYDDPMAIDAPARDFPHVNFVCSHAVWPEVTGYLRLAYAHTNVHLEPSIYWNLPGTEPFFEAANSILADQVVYASAFPFARLDAIKGFRSRIAWNEDSWRKFTHLNAARLLGLPSDLGREA